MNRRDAIFALLGLGIAGPAAAQPAAKVRKVGVLTSEPLKFHSDTLQAFRQALRDLGYVEGKNITIESRSADGKAERLNALAVELARLNVDVILVVGTSVTRIARDATKDIPIVMAYAGDPVGAGFAASLAKPGGRITGLTTLSVALGAKRMEILKEAVPKVSQIAVLWAPGVPEREAQFKDTQAAAAKLQMQVRSIEVRRIDDFDAAFAATSGARIDALFVLDDPLITSQLAKVMQFAGKRKLPTMFQRREYLDAGGLMSYAPNFPDMFRRAAGYVDRILKGAKPGELPIEQPTKLDLVINLKTAKALGLNIPRPVLMRADETID